jgi:hypothetical protein
VALVAEVRDATRAEATDVACANTSNTTSAKASHVTSAETADMASAKASHVTSAKTADMASAKAAHVTSAKATAMAAATTAASATTRQRHGRRGQANGCNSQQREHFLSQHVHSPSEIDPAPSSDVQVAIVLENCCRRLLNSARPSLRNVSRTAQKNL